MSAQLRPTLDDELSREACAIYASEDDLQGVFSEHYSDASHNDMVAELRELHTLLRNNFRRLYGYPDCGEKAANDKAWGELQIQAKQSCLFVEGLVNTEAAFRVDATNED